MKCSISSGYCFIFQDALTNYKALDDLDIIPNAEAFECLICMMDIEPGDGVVLRECLHTFCKVSQQFYSLHS